MVLSNLVGILLVLAGLWLVISGAPQVSATAGGLIGIIADLPTRSKIGIVLIILGLVAMGVDVGPVIGA